MPHSPIPPIPPAPAAPAGLPRPPRAAGIPSLVPGRGARRPGAIPGASGAAPQPVTVVVRLANLADETKPPVRVNLVDAYRRLSASQRRAMRGSVHQAAREAAQAQAGETGRGVGALFDALKSTEGREASGEPQGPLRMDTEAAKASEAGQQALAERQAGRAHYAEPGREEKIANLERELAGMRARAVDDADRQRIAQNEARLAELRSEGESK